MTQNQRSRSLPAPARPKQAKGAFDLGRYLLIVGIVVCIHLLIGLCLLSVWLFTGGHREGALLILASLTIALSAVLLLINVWQQPTYTDAVKIRPTDVARLLIYLTVIGIAIRTIVRRPTIEAKLEAGLVFIAIGVLIVLLVEAIFGAVERSGKIPNLLPAIIASFIVAAVGAVLVRPLFDLSTLEHLLAIYVILAATTMLLQGLIVLHYLTCRVTRTEYVPDDNVAVVTANRRRKWVTANGSLQVNSGNQVTLYDLRCDVLPLEHYCESRDHVQVYVYASCVYKVRWIYHYLTRSQHPRLVLEHILRACLADEISRYRGEHVIENLRAIARSVHRRMEEPALHYGMGVIEVLITRAHVTFPTLDVNMPAQLEANRLAVLDEALRNAAPSTLEHVERVDSARHGGRADAAPPRES